MRLPRWFRAPEPRTDRDARPLEEASWLELDRVRSILSCIILAVLLGLIIIGGRKASSIRLQDIPGVSGGLVHQTGWLHP